MGSPPYKPPSSPPLPPARRDKSSGFIAKVAEQDGQQKVGSSRVDVGLSRNIITTLSVCCQLRNTPPDCTSSAAAFNSPFNRLCASRRRAAWAPDRQRRYPHR